MSVPKGGVGRASSGKRGAGLQRNRAVIRLWKSIHAGPGGGRRSLFLAAKVDSGEKRTVAWATDPPPGPTSLHPSLRVAAERYGVPCVPLEHLEQVGREFGTPISWEYRFDG